MFFVLQFGLQTTNFQKLALKLLQYENNFLLYIDYKAEKKDHPKHEIKIDSFSSNYTNVKKDCVAAIKYNDFDLVIVHATQYKMVKAHGSCMTSQGINFLEQKKVTIKNNMTIASVFKATQNANSSKGICELKLDFHDSQNTAYQTVTVKVHIRKG